MRVTHKPSLLSKYMHQSFNGQLPSQRNVPLRCLLNNETYVNFLPDINAFKGWNLEQCKIFYITK